MELWDVREEKEDEGEEEKTYHVSRILGTILKKKLAEVASCKFGKKETGKKKEERKNRGGERERLNSVTFLSRRMLRTHLSFSCFLCQWFNIEQVI